MAKNYEERVEEWKKQIALYNEIKKRNPNADIPRPKKPKRESTWGAVNDGFVRLPDGRVIKTENAPYQIRGGNKSINEIRQDHDERTDKRVQHHIAMAEKRLQQQRQTTNRHRRNKSAGRYGSISNLSAEELEGETGMYRREAEAREAAIMENQRKLFGEYQALADADKREATARQDLVKTSLASILRIAQQDAKYDGRNPVEGGRVPPRCLSALNRVMNFDSQKQGFVSAGIQPNGNFVLTFAQVGRDGAVYHKQHVVTPPQQMEIMSQQRGVFSMADRDDFAQKLLDGGYRQSEIDAWRLAAKESDNAERKQNLMDLQRQQLNDVKIQAEQQRLQHAEAKEQRDVETQAMQEEKHDWDMANAQQRYMMNNSAMNDKAKEAMTQRHSALIKDVKDRYNIAKDWIAEINSNMDLSDEQKSDQLAKATQIMQQARDFLLNDNINLDTPFTTKPPITESIKQERVVNGKTYYQLESGGWIEKSKYELRNNPSEQNKESSVSMLDTKNNVMKTNSSELPLPTDIDSSTGMPSTTNNQAPNESDSMTEYMANQEKYGQQDAELFGIQQQNVNEEEEEEEANS